MGVRKSCTYLDGHLGKDPELKELDGGSKVVKFSLATASSRKDSSGEWKTETEWHRCLAWGRNAEKISEKCRKGDRLIIEGENRTRSWKDGDKTRSITEVKVNNWEKVSKTTASKAEAPVEHEEDDDLPF